jgi:hypothetical protein
VSLLIRRRAKPGIEAPGESAPVPPLRPDPELASRRDRLIERMTIMQSELGGLFYEMAIRDHVRMDVLIAKAAELQEVDTELGELQQRLEGSPQSDAVGPGHPAAGQCPACGAAYLPGAAYCSQCAHALAKG